MPELPEMETYRILLHRLVTGHTVTEAHIAREKSVNVPPDEFRRAVVGAKIAGIERRAKHLLFLLDNGNALVLHLMLGGLMVCGTEAERPDRTVQITLSFGARHLFFIGLRLGYLHLHSLKEAAARLSALGPEPFDPGLTVATFDELLRGKRGRLKPVLVDQQFIAGIGNCYSDEICHHAGILPSRQMAQLHADERERLFHSMRAVLTEAIRYGGYMETPLFAGDDLTGGYNDRCRVYDRAGEPCLRCGGLIAMRPVGSRKSFCCMNCQR